MASKTEEMGRVTKAHAEFCEISANINGRLCSTSVVGKSEAAEERPEFACTSQQEVADMASKTEGVGRVTKAHAEFCEISANINGRLCSTSVVGKSEAAEERPEPACTSQQKVADMASKTEEVGRVTKAHAEFCEISANINGTVDILSFNRRQFHTFVGIRCESDMTNLLEEGMEVSFCFSVSEQKKIVTVAWLGDKPESLLDQSQTENDGIGVITKVTKSRCAMCASINSIQETLSFHRRIFYSFGIRCEGNLTNILDEGMEVEFCYSVRGSIINIIAVWLGDRPDLKLIDLPEAVYIEDLPERVYNEKGRVVQVLDNENLIVKGNLMSDTVLVDTQVVYRHCAPNAVALAVNDDVTFDAIPLEGKDECGAKYEATCAWIGEVPRIVDRFGLNIPDDSVNTQCDLKYFQEHCVDGTVAIIVNEFVAFVDVEYRGLIEQVMLFRSSFQQSDHKCLQDIVSIGDRILLLVVIGSIFDGCRRLYAAKAWRNVDEKNGCMAEEQIVEPKILPASINAVEVDRCIPTFQDPPLVRFSINSTVLCPPLKGVLHPYSSKNLSKEKVPVLAIIRSRDNKLSVLARACDFYVDGKKCPTATFERIKKTKSSIVNFEGVLDPYPDRDVSKYSDEKFSHVATCAWVGQRPSLITLPSTKLLTTLPVSRQNKNEGFEGTVSSLYLPNKAIVTIGKLNRCVCLHVNSFPSKSGANFITDFVKLKQRISFQIVSDPGCEIPLLAMDVKLIS